MDIQTIKNKVILHKNKKIDILETYNHLTDLEKGYLFKDVLKTSLSICPLHALDLTKQIREVLK